MGTIDPTASAAPAHGTAGVVEPLGIQRGAHGLPLAPCGGMNVRLIAALGLLGIVSWSARSTAETRIPKGTRPVLKAALIASGHRVRAAETRLRKQGLPPSIVAMPARMHAELADHAPMARRSVIRDEGKEINVGSAKLAIEGSTMRLEVERDLGGRKGVTTRSTSIGRGVVFEAEQKKNDGAGHRVTRDLKRLKVDTQLADGRRAAAGSWVVRTTKARPEWDHDDKQHYVLLKGERRPAPIGEVEFRTLTR